MRVEKENSRFSMESLTVHSPVAARTFFFPHLSLSFLTFVQWLVFSSTKLANGEGKCRDVLLVGNV